MPYWESGSIEASGRLAIVAAGSGLLTSSHLHPPVVVGTGSCLGMSSPPQTSPMGPVAFPSVDSHHPPSAFQRPPYLPFRRISVPSAPNLHRQSMVSVSSFDSLPEEQPKKPATSQQQVIKKPSKSRPMSLEAARRGSRIRASKTAPPDEAKEARRHKIIREFYDTEHSYVDGLDLIYSHFLMPILASLDTPHPLLERSELTSIFSNFIDIWNLHRSFFSSLSDLYTPTDSDSPSKPLPPVSSILLSHFPYLSLYSPFVTAFPSALSTLANLLAENRPFAEFVVQQESDPRCGKLKLRDWLLTIVQRCPRYLLLLKDLISCTDPTDAEYEKLNNVHALVSKITHSLNTSLHTHSQILALLALQRSTSNLPFPLVTPGRIFMRRSSLLQLEHSSSPTELDFILFSDILIWLLSTDTEPIAEWEWHQPIKVRPRPGMVRTRSKSEAELPTLANSSSGAGTSVGVGLTRAGSKKTRHASTGGEERWIYKGHAGLVDLEVVVPPLRDQHDERRFDILSPETSFSVFADTEGERDDWVTAIRSAKSSLLVSLNRMRPDSTLTSSASTAHLRRSLQALPHLPQDEVSKPRRGRVEHFVPAVWIPDGKTESCMRCGRTFGWRRRRHHCRLCGRCVCASCSDKTFYIQDSTGKSATKSARACEACYDTVFPLIGPSSSDGLANEGDRTVTSGTLSHLQSLTSNTLSWLAMRPAEVVEEDKDVGAIPVAAGGAGGRGRKPKPSREAALPSPEALMSIEPQHRRRSLHRIEDEDGQDGQDGLLAEAASRRVVVVPQKMRRSGSGRPKSYVQILEDFQEHQRNLEQQQQRQHHDNDNNAGGGGVSADQLLQVQRSMSGMTQETGFTISTAALSGNESAVSLTSEQNTDSADSNALQNGGNGGADSSACVSPSPTPVKEDTGRRHKRFSLPAVAVQTAAVTTRPNATGEGKSKRFSLVLGGHHSHYRRNTAAREGDTGGPGTGGPDDGGSGQTKSGAAGRLSELLASSRAKIR